MEPVGAEGDDPAPGDHLWTFDPGLPASGNDTFTEPAIGADGTIYIGHIPSTTAGAGSFYAINQDGSLRWSKSLPFHGTWEQKTVGFRLPSIDPAGNIYVSAGRILYSFAADGTENWKRSFESSNLRNFAPYIYPIGISEDGRIYMPIDDQGLHELDPADGSTLWTFTSTEEHKFYFARPVTVLVDGNLLLPFWSGDFYHLAKDGSTFSRQFSADDPSSDPCMSVSASGKMFATQGYLYEEQTLMIYDGLGVRPKAVSSLKGVTVPPLIDSDGDLYIPDRYGNLYCLAADGQEKWARTGYADQAPILAQDGTLFAVTADAAAPVIRALDQAGQTLYEMAGTIEDPGAASPTYQYPHSGAVPTVRLALQRDGTLIAAANNGKVYAFYGESPLSKSDWPKAYGGYENAGRITHFAPEILQHPAGGTVVSGDGNSLEVEYIARPAATVQWYRDGLPVGAPSSTLALGDLEGGEAGDYHAVIQNAVGSVETDTITVVTQHRLSVSAGAGGGVELDPEGPIHHDGAEVTVTAVPGSGYEFVNWIEDGLPVSDANPLSLAMNESRHLVATFEDVLAPALTIDGEFPAVVADQPSIRLSGTVGDNASVVSIRISVNGGPMGIVQIGGEGTFGTTPDLVLGENTITLQVEDDSGLITEETISVEWRPSHLWSFDVPAQADEAGVIEADLVIMSPGDVAGANLRISATPAYLEFLAFEPSIELFGMFHTQSEENGALSFTFASLGDTIREGRRVIGTARYRVRSLPDERSEMIRLTEIDLAGGDGNPIPGVRSISNPSIVLTPRAIIGDVNNNGRYDAGDAQHLQRLLGGLSEFRAWDDALNDVNGNGALDIGDVIIVLRTAAGLADQPGDSQLDSNSLGSGEPPFVAAAAHGGNLSGRLQSAFDPHAPTARVVLDRQTATAGEKVTAQIWLENVPAAFGGTTYILDYPVEALRLEDSGSLSSSPLQPASTLHVWNLAPSQNDFESQAGSITFAAGSAESWPGSEAGGLIAELTFTVQAGAMAAQVWPIELREMELSTDEGLTMVRTNTHGVDFLGQVLSEGEWKSQQFSAAELEDPTISGWDADPDADGKNNLAEYFSGSGPKAVDAGSIGRPVVVETADGETYAGVEFAYDPRAIDAFAELLLSSDLRSWQEGEGLTYEVEVDGKSDDGAYRKVLIDLRPLAEGDRNRFMRLKFNPNL